MNAVKKKFPIGWLLYTLAWLVSLGLGFCALYLTVMYDPTNMTELVRLGAIMALTSFVICTRWLRNTGKLSKTTGILVLLMPLAELAVHLMLNAHPGIAYCVTAAVILLFESFFRTGGAQ